MENNTMEEGHEIVVMQPSGTVQQPSGGMVVQQPPSMVVQQPPGMAVQQHPSMFVQQPPGMAVQQQPRMFAQQPPGMMVQQHSGMFVQQPAGAVVQQPPGMMVQQQPRMFVQQPPGMVVQQPGGMVMQQPGGMVMQQPAGMVMQQPGGMVMQQPGGMVMQQPGMAVMAVPADTWMLPPDDVPENCPPGLAKLLQLDQLIISQELSNFEVLNGAVSRFKIKNAFGQIVYCAVEDWDCTRACGAFNMKLVDHGNTEVIHLSKPATCLGCLCTFMLNCCICCGTQLEVSSPPGTPIGYVNLEYSCFQPSVDICDEHKNIILTVSNLGCCTGFTTGNLQATILQGSEEVGKITMEYNAVGLNFRMTFPMDLDAKLKATAIAAILLLVTNMIRQAQRAQQAQQAQSHGGGGGGGHHNKHHNQHHQQQQRRQRQQRQRRAKKR